MLHIALVISLAALAAGRAPFQALLTSCPDAKTDAWIDGALDAALLVTQTLFGGYSCSGQLIAGCYEYASQALLDQSICVSTSGRDSCRYAGCNLADHPELNDPDTECCHDGAGAAEETGDAPSEDAVGCVYRTVRQWIAIGFHKLALAHDAREAPTPAPTPAPEERKRQAEVRRCCRIPTAAGTDSFCDGPDANGSQGSTEAACAGFLGTWGSSLSCCVAFPDCPNNSCPPSPPTNPPVPTQPTPTSAPTSPTPPTPVPTQPTPAPTPTSPTPPTPPTPAPTPASALSNACAAELILTQVLIALSSPFLAPPATYRHIVGAKRHTTFFPAYSVASRTIQSFRDCTQSGGCGAHALVATYTTFELSTDTHQTDGTYQLLWPIGGRLSAFDKTHLPAGALCALAQAETDLSPADNPTLWRLPTLGRLDFARVAQGFARCDALPRNGHVRGYHDLSDGHCCNTLALLDDVEAAHRLLPHDTDPTPFSFAYVAHYRSAFTYEQDPVREVDVARALVLRRATPDRMCGDVGPLAVLRTAHADRVQTRLAQLPAGTPLTLAPGESRCVGGEAAGELCTKANECGVGLACRVRPGATGRDERQGYCFDGVWWNAALPCDVAFQQCAYGECYGAVSGDAGGAFPWLHVWRANQCGDPERATALCADPRVREWHAHHAEQQ